ncbi:hypothetical protein JK636_04670 [Clostridium sp. YIM B02515]|uniref:Uncharacterized protein n=1 Tax=Clostridium rhizosphaerae TaxID=2803861 RepID=A0ABS1TAL2_9CLOT|nr:hypothetical protein [Clostridium rhizosphaerae]MBL4935048.1 hypothetical protein [Clostridium rhizosphaerae]
MNIIEEVKNLYSIIELKPFRKTEGVIFDLFPMDSIAHIDSIDRVLHEHSAVSPGPVGSVSHPWYLHPHQDDNLLVLHGRREVDIYNKAHGKVEHFTVYPDKILKNGELLYNGGAMLVWPAGVFHRIVSGEDGSASINLAVHHEGFDIRTNFNIYDLNTETGEYHLIREGHKDQML